MYGPPTLLKYLQKIEIVLSQAFPKYWSNFGTVFFLEILPKFSRYERKKIASTLFNLNFIVVLILIKPKLISLIFISA